MSEWRLRMRAGQQGTTSSDISKSNFYSKSTQCILLFDEEIARLAFHSGWKKPKISNLGLLESLCFVYFYDFASLRVSFAIFQTGTVAVTLHIWTLTLSTEFSILKYQ